MIFILVIHHGTCSKTELIIYIRIMSFIVAVPARLNSLRLKNKLMHVINNRTILHITLSKISNVFEKDIIYVFCDNAILYDETIKHGYNAVMVEDECTNGTERVCKGVKLLQNKNVQFENILIIHADQPLLEKENIKSIYDFWSQGPKDINTMYTLHTKCTDYENKSIAKIALNPKTGKWLYISRQDIPTNNDYMYNHFGLCMFSKQLLENYYNLENGFLQLCEDNEWLKLLENGYTIVSKEIDHHDTDLNTPKDLMYIESKLNILKNVNY